MPKQFKGKYLVRFNRTKPYDKIDIWNLEVLDIANPVSTAYRDEVLYAYKDFEKLKDALGTSENIIEDKENGVKWLLISSPKAYSSVYSNRIVVTLEGFLEDTHDT